MIGAASAAPGFELIVMEKSKDRWRCQRMAFLLMQA
jgi:hypothetical protein